MPADPAEIEARIAATRTELAATLTELGDRVSPKQVMARKQAALRGKLDAFMHSSQLGPDGEPIGGPPWPKIVAGAAAALVLVKLVARRRRRRSG